MPLPRAQKAALRKMNFESEETHGEKPWQRIARKSCLIFVFPGFYTLANSRDGVRLATLALCSAIK